MSESTEVTEALLTQALKLVKAMSDQDAKQLLTGDAKLALVPRGHRILEYTGAVDRTLKVLQQLSSEELQQVEDRQAKVVVLRKGEKVTKPFDPVEVAEAVTKLATKGDIVRHLDSDASLGAPNLKKVATALNLPLPQTVKSKQAIQLYIAENVVRDRHRWRLQ